jgi:hypothetical protein
MDDGFATSKSVFYVIKVKGRLEERWSERFKELYFTYESDGTTTLSGPLPDQAALHSILNKIRDMNLTIVSFKQRGSDKKHEPCKV